MKLDSDPPRSQAEPLALAMQSTPLPALVYDPRQDRITAHSATAAALFKTRNLTRLAPFLASDPAEFSIFLEAVLHFGSYEDTALEFRSGKDTPLQLEIFGRAVPEDPDQRVVLTFYDLKAQNRRAAIAEQNAHHRAGYGRWREVHRFFQEVERENQLILDAAGEGIYGINAEGKATFVNRAAQEMLGWDAKDLIGKDLHAIIHHHHLNGDPFPARTCPIYRSFRMDETMRVDDDAFWRKDGKPILVEYVSTPIYDRGLLAGAVVIFRDVTERRENERKLHAALAEIEELKAQLERENDYLLTEMRTSRSQKGLIGRSAYTRRLNAQIALVAQTDTSVLVSGKPGSGKAQIVSLIHDASSRGKRPLVRVDCSAKSVRELETELFGHRKGAWRGADRDRIGKLVLAQSGTLHLENIAEMPLEVQAKLVDALRDGHFRRPGASEDTQLRTRFISSTSRDLDDEVRAGRFRQDLLFELGVFPIRCQDLAERKEDITPLVQHFLEQASRRARLPVPRLSRANIETLERYDWPGNVRELRNVVERAAILAQGGKLQFDFPTHSGTGPLDQQRILTHEDLRALERQNLLACLHRAGGKVAGETGAARLLGLAPTTVYSRIKALGIDPKSVASPK